MAASDEPSIVPRGVLPMRLCEVGVKPPYLFPERGAMLPFISGSSRDLGEVEVDRQGAGKLAVYTTTITLLSPCIVLVGQVIPRSAFCQPSPCFARDLAGPLSPMPAATPGSYVGGSKVWQLLARRLSALWSRHISLAPLGLTRRMQCWIGSVPPHPPCQPALWHTPKEIDRQTRIGLVMDEFALHKDIWSWMPERPAWIRPSCHVALDMNTAFDCRWRRYRPVPWWLAMAGGGGPGEWPGECTGDKPARVVKSARWLLLRNRAKLLPGCEQELLANQPLAMVYVLEGLKGHLCAKRVGRMARFWMPR